MPKSTQSKRGQTTALDQTTSISCRNLANPCYWEHYTLKMTFLRLRWNRVICPRLRWSFPRFWHRVNASLSGIHGHAYVGTHTVLISGC